MNLKEVNLLNPDLTLPQIKAFFLGAMKGEKPLSPTEAFKELCSEITPLTPALELVLKEIWEEVKKSPQKELKNLFPVNVDVFHFLETAQLQLDAFLTALNLSGTYAESCEDEDLAEILDELEDMVLDLDEYLSLEDPSKDDGEELKSGLMETWEDLVNTISKT